MILYDASAFFELLKQEKLDHNAFLLDLSIYEIGNVIWKHSSILKQITESEAGKIINLVEDWPNIIRIDTKIDSAPILGTALQEKLTFYDSAYIYFPKKYSLHLHTCDKKLYKTAQKKKIQATLIKEAAK